MILIGSMMATLQGQTQFPLAAIAVTGRPLRSHVTLPAGWAQAVVEVDEKGTEAAATTAIMMVRAMLLPPEELTFDRPFVFCVAHDASASPLFVGGVADPSG